MRQQLRVAVVVASAGRPELLAEALQTIGAQEGVEFETVVSVPDQASLPSDRSVLDGVTVVVGTRGAAAQRNAGIDAALPHEVVAIFDDDSVLRPDWLALAVDFFQQHPHVIALTGRVLLDGAVSGEVSRDDADEAIARSAAKPFSGRWTQVEELYGCNMAFRLDLAGNERFDERLPLYSWLEDHDLARRLMRKGVLAKVDDCVVVHRAAASGGRQNHVRLGYSQVMNPVYLASKGSFTPYMALAHPLRRVAKNALLALAPNPQQALRRQRLRGNILAALDACKGRRTPERITQL